MRIDNKKDSFEIWRERLQALETSGKTQKEWCSDNNIKISTLRYWIRKLRSADRIINNDNSKWVNVADSTKASSCMGMIQILVNGIEIDISSEADPIVKEKILKGLMDI